MNSLFGPLYTGFTTVSAPVDETSQPNNILTVAQGGLDDADQFLAFGDTYLFGPTLVNQVPRET
jgi:hypothetical protein